MQLYIFEQFQLFKAVGCLKDSLDKKHLSLETQVYTQYKKNKELSNTRKRLIKLFII